MEEKSLDPKYLNIPNINFSIMKDEFDDREDLFREQRIKRGFDDSETWCLASTIARFIIPRLEVFTEVSKGACPEDRTIEEWEDILNTILSCFKLIDKDEGMWDWNKEEGDIVTRGLSLFNEHFLDLWW